LFDSIGSQIWSYFSPKTLLRQAFYDLGPYRALSDNEFSETQDVSPAAGQKTASLIKKQT
jgi:hypothetical protein